MVPSIASQSGFMAASQSKVAVGPPTAYSSRSGRARIHRPMRLLRTRMLGLLSAIVFAIPAAVFAQPGYLCLSTGQVSVSCCCASKHASKRCEPEVKRQSCCQLIEAEHSVAPSVASDSSRLVAAAVVATPLPQFAMVSTGWASEPEPARVTHPPGPPRFLVKCSFLI